MNRLAGFLTTLAFLAQLQLYAAAQQPPDPQKLPSATSSSAVEAPTFSVGDTWEYRRPNRPERGSKFKLTVTEVKGDRVTLVNRAGVKFVFTKEGNIVEDPGQKERYDPYIGRLQFPLQEGKKWLSQHTLHSERWERAPNVVLKAKVDRWERVSVPAGTFDAIRIQISQDRQAVAKIAAAGHEEVCWYAQEVKRFIKCTFSEHLKESDFELVSYQVK